MYTYAVGYKVQISKRKLSNGPIPTTIYVHIYVYNQTYVESLELEAKGTPHIINNNAHQQTI